MNRLVNLFKLKTTAKSLHEAAEIGDLKTVRKFLSKGTCVNSKDKSGGTPLHCAVRKTNTEIAELLLEWGSEVNIADGGGYTPLHTAISKHADEELVQMLLSRGASMNAKDKSGRSPLHLAVENNKLEVAKSLLECGADVNIADDRGYTPLHAATSCHVNVKVVKMLLNKGAFVNAKDKAGETPLHLASEKNIIEAAKSLLECGADVNIADDRGYTPLHTFSCAISWYADAKLAQVLLIKGACVNAKSKSGETPFLLAVKKRSLEVAKLLLEWGADVNESDNEGIAPLYYACNAYAELVKLLLTKGACVNAKDMYGKTPLQLAVKNVKLEVVKLLLDWGANVNVADEHGHTPLHTAVMKFNFEVAEYLLVWGADVNAENKEGFTPLGIAHPPVLMILKRHVIKLKAANVFVSDKNLQAVNQNDEMTSFQLKCEEEVEHLKKENICSGVSFLDVWIKNVPRLARLYAGSEYIFKGLKPDDVNTKFPIYGRIVNVHLSAFLERTELLEWGYRLFNSTTRLPLDCIGEILGYLSNEDLKKSHEVFCNESWA